MGIKDSKLKWVYLTGFFLILALPLLNLPPWFSPPDWGKTITFRIIFSILIFLFIYQLLFEKPDTTFCTTIRKAFSKNNKSYLVFRLLIALLGIYFLATIFSLDIHFSLWGNPYRAEGFIVFAFQILFAILLFLLLQKKDWQKIWNFAIIIGILVSLIAIFQQFGLFSKIFVSFGWRAPSTIGGPSFLAIYLLLLSFLTLSFGIKEKKYPKKVFYFLSLLLFLFVIIFITKTRAAYIGLAAGFLWFLFFYPKKLILLKISAAVLLVLAIFGFYFLKTHPEIYSSQNSLMKETIDRILNIPLTADQARVSAWKVSFQAIKNRPLLGYGPENFSIGFDKYYDPSLPSIQKPPAYYYPQASWWDRAHNFILDIGVTAGVPALVIYLSLFAVLFYKLQKLKYNPDLRIKSGCSEYSNAIIAHGIQTTFLAYLAANLFSFDTFSSYIILFLLVGYSLHLISDGNLQIESESKKIQRTGLWKLQKYRGAIISVLFISLIWFIWNFNLKPFPINKEINLALYESKAGYCEAALNRMKEILPTKSFLDNYLRLKYIDVIDECIKEKPELSVYLSQKAVEALEKSIKVRPTYTRNWLLIGAYTNILIEAGQENLKDEVNYYFEKAYQLSPKRQEVFLEWVKADLLTGEIQKAKTKAQKCIDLNPEVKDCYWLMGLCNIYLGDTEKAQKNMEIAFGKKCGADSYTCAITSKIYLLQLAKAYGDTKNYEALLEVYQILISGDPDNAQYHASVAFVYKELGDIENAKKYALKVLEIMPEAKEDVERFLEELSH